jgi:predicted acetyltransferase
MNLPNVILRHLTLADKEKFLEANDDPSWMKEGFIFAHYWESIAKENFETFVKLSPEFSKGLHIPPEHVPCTMLTAFNSDGSLVGRVSIRHELNERLLQIGGHIGYAVVPKHRRVGYATAILKESLNYVRNHLPNIQRILVTCDAGNTGSKKTIERNGGILENTITYEGKEKFRYWIILKE